jgi:hypothetical protein
MLVPLRFPDAQDMAAHLERRHVGGLVGRVVHDARPGRIVLSQMDPSGERLQVADRDRTTLLLALRRWIDRFSCQESTLP